MRRLSNMRPPAEDDAAVVLRAAAGETQAFRRLYEKYRPMAWGVARGFGELDRDDVDDVVQESFVRAFRSLGALRQPARFGPWLLTIVRNRTLTRLTQQKAGESTSDGLRLEIESLGLAVEGPAFEDTTEGELDVVRRVIAELPEGPEKEIVRLFYVEGQLSARGIAKRLGVSGSVITMRLARFRGKVKKRILADVARFRGEEAPRRSLRIRIRRER